MEKLFQHINIINSSLLLTLLVLMGIIYTDSNKIQNNLDKSDKLKKTVKLKTKEIKKLKTEVDTIKMASLVQFTEDDLNQDIKLNYPNISDRVKHIIIHTIMTQSSKYNINPLILYSLLHTESSMRPWIEHRKVLIKIGKKKKYIRAVGLGGVVWEWWSKQLISNNIAEVRSDLFNPKINIEAVAYIYNSFYNMKKLKKASTQDESAMIRYFGGGYKSYFEKIDKKVAQLISRKMYRRAVIK